MAELLSFPFMTEPAIPDAAERELALDITRSFIVEAPAGSGKTGLLIQRFLKLLASESVTDPTQILAITFTRKATHEMRDRILHQLAAAQCRDLTTNDFDRDMRLAAEAALARDRKLNWGLLDHPNLLNISTIDAVCAQIARSLPVLGAADQAPMEDPSNLYTEAARRTLNLLGGDDPALTVALEVLLLHRDGNLADCEGLIAEMLGLREQWGDLVPLSGEQLTERYLETVTLPKLEKALDHAICRALTRLTELMPPRILEQLCALASEMAHAEGYKGAPSPIALCKNRNQPPSERSEDLEHWAALAHLLVRSSKPRGWRKAVSGNFVGFEILQRHQSELKSIIAALEGRDELFEALCSLTKLPPAKYPQEQWLVAKALFRVLSRALVELQLVFTTRGQCDFPEFALLARTALRESHALEHLTSSTGFDLQHLLVDEMQDTSSSQYELIRLLTGNWDGASQTVFLVGDPKQSIYLFRQARVERFLDTFRTERLGDLPLTSLHLTANLRSQPKLVDSFNETFTRIFPSASDRVESEEVPYRPAIAMSELPRGPEIKWHTAEIPYDSDRKILAECRKRQARENAADISRLVAHWRAKPLPPGRDAPWTIAVLVRNRNHLLEVVQAFKQDGIPFRAIKTEPLAERQEILDLLALTRALLHPADRTAWLALLRTPWCGLTLRDLHLLAGADDSAWSERTILEVIEQRGDLLSNDGLARLQSFYTVLSAALSERGRIPPAQWVERTWRAFAADRFASEEELANVARFLQLLDQLDAQPGAASIDRLEQRISNLYAAESTAPEAVDLMTIHTAKGLEWDFVVVPALQGTAQTTRSRLLTWLEIEGGNEAQDDVAHGIIAPVQPKGTDALALNKWMNSIHAARDAAERKRLFYVACTRAREELHLFAAPDSPKDGEIKPRYDSLLKAAWPAAEPHFAAVAEEPGVMEAIAAAGLSLVLPWPEPQRTIQRIPHMFFPAASLAPSSGPRVGFESVAFDRPEGSFDARAFGNAMHAFLEVLARRIAAGAATAALLDELPTWSTRIATVLRSSGLAPAEVPRAAANVLRGLTRTLEDADGQWILAAHPQAASESSVTVGDATIRLDRTFLAGEKPLTQASTHLWIIDYKTGSHGSEGLEAFLAREREKYTPQLEAYGHHLAAQGLPVRLALYYPTLPKLIWWSFEPETNDQ
jgi:ATP-dependent helicase/nuclease subunit A